MYHTSSSESFLTSSFFPFSFLPSVKNVSPQEQIEKALQERRKPIKPPPLGEKESQRIEQKDDSWKKGHSPLNTIRAPGFNPLTMVRSLRRALEGNGGYLDQAWLYVLAESAEAWGRFSNQFSYLQTQKGQSYFDIADEIAYWVRKKMKPSLHQIEILGLGTGDAKYEVQFAQQLVEAAPFLSQVQLSLLDSSPYLLMEASDYAENVLSSHSMIQVRSIAADMYKLPEYYPLEKKRDYPCIATLIGGTFFNLPNEGIFVRDSLRAFQEGDFLLLDLGQAYASAEDEEAIYQKDPRLSGKIPKGMNQAGNDFLKTPFEAHFKSRLKSIDIIPELDTQSVSVDRSYSVNMKAHITLQSGEEKDFTVQRFVRYEIPPVLKMFASFGWKAIRGWKFGEKQNYLLYLFQKQ